MSIQTTYGYSSADVGISGMLSDAGTDSVVLNATAMEIIKPGKALVWYGGTRDKVRLPQRNVVVISLTADLVSGDDFDFGITLTDINGTAGSELAISTVSYASSHGATMTAIANAITALSADVTATLTDSSNNREITVTIGNDKTAEVTTAAAVTSGGAGTSVASSVYACADTIIGISQYDSSQEANSSGVVQFAANTVIGVIRKGRPWVVSEEALTLATSALYARFVAGAGTNEERGTIRASAGSGALATAFSGAQVAAACSADELGKIEFNLP